SIACEKSSALISVALTDSIPFYHKVVGGVCGGLGRHYGIDPVVFRVPLAVISVLGGMGLIVYGVAWLLIPFEDEEENEGRRLLRSEEHTSELQSRDNLVCRLRHE